MTMPNLTEEILAKGESIRVEFLASSLDKAAVGRAVCAMLNTKGGVVLVGVDECGKVVKSVSEMDADELRTYLYKKITPRSLFTVTLDKVKDGQVITVEVPKGTEVPYVFEGAVFVREKDKTCPADAATLRTMVVRQTQEPERWERRIAVGLSVDDLDCELLEKIAHRAWDHRGRHFENAGNPEAVLADLALARSGQLTHAADVLFGRRVALRHPQTRLRAVCYETDRSDRFIDEQLYEGPAFVLLEAAMAFLRRHVAIAAEFAPGQLARESRPQYPFNSLREALVNALVHRNYADFSGGVSVSIYPTRIEIWNSGKLLPGLNQQKLCSPTHASILVNPDISYVFYLYGLMERVGRGTYKIVQECRQLGMRNPQWRNVDSGVRLTFHAVGSVSKTFTVSSRQQALLDELRVDESINMREYIRKFGDGVSERQARRDLSELVDVGILAQIGAGRATAYRRIKESI